ncbi:MAG: hypothetical protein BGN88_10030 [Clostridiales bacterium 43-6]|nr:MAG: hypothetical protein BGN88_10030 [Clostridiales bacterium 43-6]
MNIIIKALTPDLAPDYLDFFDHSAFSDHQEWAGCYCTHFHMDNVLEQKIRENVNTSGGTIDDALRELSTNLINKNILCGYLAYLNGIVVGWCNSNRKTAYSRFDFNTDDSEFIRNFSNNLIKSVTCFTIAPEFRGVGIATALLKRVCEDAKADAYDVVEAYPRLRDRWDPFDHNGPIRLYEKSGFKRAVQQGNIVIMRKVL